MKIDRLVLLEEIKKAGIHERDEDEFTANELSDAYGVRVTGLHQYMDYNNIQYTRRKARAEGRERFVYRIVKDKK